MMVVVLELIPTEDQSNRKTLTKRMCVHGVDR
jgi:hypothetical protein